MRLLAISFLLLATVAGCKRASSEPPPDTPTKPDGCADVDDCEVQGTLAILAGNPQGIAMLDYACAKGSPAGCQNLSTALRANGDLPRGYLDAYDAARRGCKLGNASACVDHGFDIWLNDMLRGTDSEFAAALEHFKTGCEGGAATGCRYLGIHSREGIPGSPDPVAAMKWFETGCEMADSESCLDASELIINGAVEGDLETAVVFMFRACELGEPIACTAIEGITTEIEAESAKVPGANLRFGSATVAGLMLEGLECRVEGEGLGLLGNMALIGALAKRRASIDKCGKKGNLVEVTWTATGGKITAATGTGSEGECVAKVLKNLATPADGECAATIVLGS